MKKTLLIIGIVLLVSAAVCLALALYFHWAVYSVLDGSQNLYDRLFRMRRSFLLSGIGLSVSGALILVIRRLMKF